MPTVTSPHEFQKMLKLKLDTAYSPAMWRLFEGIGCDTMEDLAHSVGDIRGDIDVALLSGIARDVTGTNPPLPSFVNKLKVIAFKAREAVKHAAAREFSIDPDDAPKLSSHERLERRKALKDRFRPLNPSFMKGPLEPSHHMEDVCYQWIHLDRIDETLKAHLCTSKPQEEVWLNGKRLRQQHTLVSFDMTTGRLVKKVEVEPAQAVVDNRLEFEHVLTRLSTVLELTGIMKYEHHEEWATELKTATQPENPLGPHLHRSRHSGHGHDVDADSTKNAIRRQS